MVRPRTRSPEPSSVRIIEDSSIRVEEDDEPAAIWLVSGTPESGEPRRWAVKGLTVEHDAFPGWRIALDFTLDGRVTCVAVLAEPDTEDAGITARMLSRMPLGQILTEARAFMYREQRSLQKALPAERRTVVPEIVAELSRRPGRKGKSDLPYVEIAAEYVDLLSRSRSPIQELAKSRQLRASRARNIVHEARRRGLLSSPGQTGSAGGQLTQKALDLLKTPTAEEGTDNA